MYTLATATNDHTGSKSCQAQQNWTNKDWKNAAWSDESPFLLWHLDGWVRIWNNQHESMDHWFWWWWCNGVRDIFLAHFSSWELRKKKSFSWTFFVICLSTTEDINEQAGSQEDKQRSHLGSLVPNKSTKVLLLIFSIPLWPLCTHLQMAASSRITCCVRKFK